MMTLAGVVAGPVAAGGVAGGPSSRARASLDSLEALIARRTYTLG
jgi:hypothetical protein